MKLLPQHFKKIIFCLVIILLFPAIGFPQGTGRWVELLWPEDQYLDFAYDCEGNIGIITKDRCDHVMVFDARKGAWERIELGKVYIIEKVEANENLGWGYGYNKLFGYSSVTGTWDTITIAGSILSESGYGNARSLGATSKFAFVVTDQRFYVFDVDVGRWISHEIDWMPDYSGALFYYHKGYVVMKQVNSDAQHIKLVVYSTYTKDFNQIEPGCHIYDLLDKGFKGEHYDGINHVRVIGYWAVDNQFDPIDIQLNEGETYEPIYPQSSSLDSIITGGFFTKLTDTDNRIIYINFYGYTTITGNWYSADYQFDLDYYNLASSGLATSLISYLDYNYRTDETSHTWYRGSVIFNALDGSFHRWETDIIYNTSTSFGIKSGKTYIFGNRNDNIMKGHNCETGETMQSDCQIEIGQAYGGGENYAYYMGKSEGETNTWVYIYNGESNHWLASSYPTADYIVALSKEKYSVFVLEPYNTVLIYDASDNELIEADLPDGAPVYIDIKSDLASAATNGGCLIYDFSRKKLIEKPYEWTFVALGTGGLIGRDNEQQIVFAYSRYLGEWQEFPVNEETEPLLNKGNIGLLTNRVNGLLYSKYYAYNSLYGTLVPLEPEGYHVWFAVGDNTALVIRRDRVYAFDPQSATRISDKDPENIVVKPELYQNYPNPFNPVTRIRFAIPNRSLVKMTIFNNLGQQVKQLISCVLAPGVHEVEWDASEQASGIYYYRLETPSFTETKKMILLK